MVQKRTHILVLAKDEPSIPKPYNYYGFSRHPFWNEYQKERGWCTLWKTLRTEHVVTAVTVIVKSSHDHGSVTWRPGFKGVCVPDMRDVYMLLRHDWLPAKNLIILALGDEEAWRPFLKHRSESYHNWILGYPSPDGRYPPCDVMLDPSKTLATSYGPLLGWPFPVPVDEKRYHTTLYPVGNPIDLCIDCDDRHKILDIMEALRLLYASEPQSLVLDDKNVVLRGHPVFARCKIYLSMGDQINRQRIAEATACGCIPVIADMHMSSQHIAKQIHEILSTYHSETRNSACRHYRDHYGMEEIVISFSILLRALFGHIKSDTKWLAEALHDG